MLIHFRAVVAVTWVAWVAWLVGGLVCGLVCGLVSGVGGVGGRRSWGGGVTCWCPSISFWFNPCPPQTFQQKEEEDLSPPLRLLSALDSNIEVSIPAP